MRRLLLLLPTLWWVSASYASALPEGTVDPDESTAIEAPVWAENRVLVRLTPAAAAQARAATGLGSLTGSAPHGVARVGLASLDRLAATMGLRFEPAFAGESPPADPALRDFTAYWVVHLPAPATLDAALDGLRALADVATAETIPILPVAAVPNDSLWGAAWWANQESGPHVGALEAWEITGGDPSVIIAILDTGVIPYHPDLAGNLHVNAPERDGLPGIDDDGNGFVDDVSGWDFVALPEADSAAVFAGEDWRDEDADPNDFAGHGTAVAGIAGAVTHNGIGVASMAWRSRLLPVRVGWSAALLPGGVVDLLFVARGLRYATRMGASVVNMSFATRYFSALDDAVTEATAAGVLVVVAAANNGLPQVLGSRDDVLSVSSTDHTDRITRFSNRNRDIDLAAPGTNLPTTTLRRTTPDSVGRRQPTYTTTANGTSFSAPLVAGAAALLQAQRRAHGLPPLDPYDILLRLRETAANIDDANPIDTGFGPGRLDVARALSPVTTSRTVEIGVATIGPPVVIPHRDAAPRLAVATADGRLLLVDAASGAVVRDVTLPGRPLSHLAAAELGGGRGLGLFVATENGRIAGYHANGDPRPGWPVAPGDGVLDVGPALGDLDGDGTIEIVCGSSSGAIWAWRADGSVVPGFPRRENRARWSGAVALGDLDGTAGVEIVAMTVLGNAYAWRGDGTILAGWPVDLGWTPIVGAPVIGRFTHAGPPVAVFCNGIRVTALDASGAHRLRTGLPGTVSAQPAVADVNGDGADELLVPIVDLDAFVVLDSTGIVSPAWMRPLPDPALGAPIVAPLRAGGGRGILMRQGLELLALAAATAESLPSFPKPGSGGAHFACADLDSNGSTEVVVASNENGRLFLYDAGPGTWSDAPTWSTTRGDFARTGSSQGAAPLAAVDDVAPAAVGDLAITAISDSTVTLAWTGVGDDAAAGTPERYEIHALAAEDPAAGRSATIVAPPSGGERVGFELSTLVPGVRYQFEVVAVDRSGNRGATSNVVDASTHPGPAGPVAFTIVAVAQPARLPVRLLWNGDAGRRNEVHVFDVRGRRLRTLDAGPERGGEVVWDGRDTRGLRSGPGVYFARLASGARTFVTRFVVLE